MTEDLPAFEVKTLTAGRTVMEYSEERAESLREELDRALTVLACPDCGDLAPVTGGIPRSMPLCPVCGDLMHGVVEVTELQESKPEDSNRRRVDV